MGIILLIIFYSIIGIIVFGWCIGWNISEDKKRCAKEIVIIFSLYLFASLMWPLSLAIAWGMKEIQKDLDEKKEKVVSESL